MSGRSIRDKARSNVITDLFVLLIGSFPTVERESASRALDWAVDATKASFQSTPLLRRTLRRRAPDSLAADLASLNEAARRVDPRSDVLEAMRRGQRYRACPQ
jgi:hypothetical protein